MEIEQIILCNLQKNEDYMRKVIPFLKTDYFLSNEDKMYFIIVNDFIQKYNKLPVKSIIDVEIDKLKINEDTYKNLIALSDAIDSHDNKEEESWLISETEQFCKDKSLYLALAESLEISQGNNDQLSTTAIPEILQQALAVSFDTNVGHDYIEDADKRFEYYHQKSVKVPFDIKILNDITGGGVERKTVNCLAAGTGVGKSAVMCYLAGWYIQQGYNVLYITNEMAEEKLAKRIDANLMNVPISDIDNIAKSEWDKKILNLKTKCKAKLKFKEYAPGTTHVGHYRFLLRELKIKQNFVPDIIFVDYMNICASSRIKNRSDMYLYVKSIAEELRAFAIEYNVVLWTATQLNRSGINNSEVELDGISESMGGPMTFDFLLALIMNEELAQLGQIKAKQLKSRYGDAYQNSSFTMGYDKPKMKLFDLNNSSMSTSPTRHTSTQTQGIIGKAKTSGVLGSKSLNIQKGKR